MVFSGDTIKQVNVNEKKHILQFEDHLRYIYDPSQSAQPVKIENKGFVPVELHSFENQLKNDETNPNDKQKNQKEANNYNQLNILQAFGDIFDQNFRKLQLGPKTSVFVYTTRPGIAESLRSKLSSSNLLFSLLDSSASKGKSPKVIALSVINFDGKELLLVSSLGKVKLISQGMIQRAMDDYQANKLFVKKVYPSISPK